MSIGHSLSSTEANEVTSQHRAPAATRRVISETHSVLPHYVLGAGLCLEVRCTLVPPFFLLRLLHAVVSSCADQRREDARRRTAMRWSRATADEPSSLELIREAEWLDRERAWIESIMREQAGLPAPVARMAVTRRATRVYYRGHRVQLTAQNRAIFELLVRSAGEVIDIDIISDLLSERGLLRGQLALRPTDLRQRLINNFVSVLPKAIHAEIRAMIQTRQGLRLDVSPNEIVWTAT